MPQPARPSLSLSRPSSRLIGLAGRSGAGKDTAFQFLADSLPFQFERRAFADSMKASAMAAFGLSADLADEFKTRATVTVAFGENEPVVSLTGREFIQRYGTEAHRHIFGDEFWIDRTLTDFQPQAITVVTDVRLDNEADAIRALDGEVWLIERPGDRIAESGHITEAGISGPDEVIVNDSSLGVFRDRVMEAWHRGG